MKRIINTTIVVALVAFGACAEADPEIPARCEAVTKHVSELVQREKKASDDVEVDQKTQDNAAEKLLAACLAAPPDKEQAACALAADSTAAMRKCDNEDEDEDKEEEK